MDLGNLMDMAKQLKERLSTAETEAAALRVTGESGGGLVQVVMNGKHEVVELKIDPKAISSAPSDVRLLEDLIRAAVNQAAGQVAVGLKDRLGSFARDFGMDVSALESLLRK